MFFRLIGAVFITVGFLFIVCHLFFPQAFTGSGLAAHRFEILLFGGVLAWFGEKKKEDT